MNTSVVSIIKCKDYSPEGLNTAVRQAIRLAGLETQLDGRKRVLIKPNLLSARDPDEAVTTHPSVVEAIGKIAVENGCSVSIGDSPPFMGENPAKYIKLCEKTGMASAATLLGADIQRFEDDVVSIPNPSGRFYKSFDIAQAVLSTDLLINVPKLKTHGLTAFTGAIKNIFGCVPGIRKGLFHVQAADDREAFAQMLVDLLSTIKPSFHVMDAVIGMEGEGPNAGTPKEIGLIIASADPVALDAAACAIVGIDPFSIDTTRLAHNQGLGCGDIKAIQIVGEQIDDVKTEDFKHSSGANNWIKIPAPIRRVLRKHLIASPEMVSSECIGCGDCFRVCPVKAITPGKPPQIDLTKCIRCYCCQEVCNPKAIYLKKSWLGRAVERHFTKK